ncbi:hypothetical protein ACF0H5_006476 [Mactra antiquata]
MEQPLKELSQVQNDLYERRKVKNDDDTPEVLYERRKNDDDEVKRKEEKEDEVTVAYETLEHELTVAYDTVENELYVHQRRQKRATGTAEKSPETGFRIRREYRMLSDAERFDYHAAVNELKRSGRYDSFANIHRGRNVDSAHGGPNFLGWHRVYIALYEDALRLTDPNVILPYWDSSIDFHMANPVDSIIWTASFLGNGDGFVRTGPFANWNTPTGRLARNVGGSSRLISKQVIDDILTRCRMSEISMPTAIPRYNLERHHGGPHNWIGGHMRTSDTAAHDPVFFMHHAFIDYIWELFRLHQVEDCRVDPTTDYPRAIGLHAPKRTMAGFSDFRNIDGIRGYWTQTWYRYEYTPECSQTQRSCGSPYLRCDVRNQRCISAVRTSPRVSVGFAIFARNNGMDPETANDFRARSESSRVNSGRVFLAPPADPRTQDGRSFLARRANFFF